MRLPENADDFDELAARLALWRIKGIGPQLFRQLLQHYGQAKVLFNSSVNHLTILSSSLIHALSIPDWYGVERDLAWLAIDNHSVLWMDGFLKQQMPPALLAIIDPPALLFVNGNIDCLRAQQLAMVGSRRPSAYGLAIAYDLAAQLAALDLIITSGLAIGIDSQCHRGALAVKGKACAVLAVGLDSIYPKQHSALAQQLLDQGGALLSEFPIGTPPLPQHFPRRNRLISGLGAGVIVVEAALKSGSLITAHCAADQGREVFAVPGSIRQHTFQGCHALIKEGAHLVENIGDIYAVLPDLFKQMPLVAQSWGEKRGLVALNGKEKQLLAVLEEVPLTFADIQQRLPLKSTELNVLLTTLALKGYLSGDMGGYYLNP